MITNFSSVEMAQNTLVLEQFEQKYFDGLYPKLVICGQQLRTLPTVAASGVIGKIKFLFQAFINNALLYTGVLSYDEKKIQAIKDRVYNYHLEKIKHLFRIEFDKLSRDSEQMEPKRKQVRELNETISTLQQRVSSLQQDVRQADCKHQAQLSKSLKEVDELTKLHWLESERRRFMNWPPYF